MKRPSIAAAACLLSLLAICQRAAAISVQRDTIPDLPPITRLPSSVPPNNAVHRNPRPTRPVLPPDAGEVDTGPDADATPVAVPASSAPWAAAISESQNLARDFLCGGVLVAPAWVLTAAHCTFLLVRRWPRDADPYVFLETPALDAPGPQFAAEEIITHPQYDARTLQNDIALIRIDAKTAANTVPLGVEGIPIAEQLGKVATILGWGVTTSADKYRHRENLQLLQVAVINDGPCVGARSYPDVQKDSVFCASSLLMYRDVCFRFGGSPLVAYDNRGKLYVAGLVSWPIVCPQDHRKPNTFLDVQHYVPWIKSVINDGKKP